MTKSNYEDKEGTVEIVRGDIVLYTDANPYRIGLGRCSSRRQIDEWVAHLSQKYWASPDMLAEFARLASAHHRLPSAGPGG
jgi:hypothetical protein